MSSHAFKEWTRICLALGQGSQSLILRKGGIHEKSGGFQWDHDSFWLFPTRFHEEHEALRPGAPSDENNPPLATEEDFEIRWLARIERKERLADLETAHALADLHFWTPGVVEDRFEWSDERCLWLALVRVYEAPEPVRIPWEKRFGGCRSWLDLPQLPDEDSLQPVLDDASHEAINQRLDELLPPSED